MNFGKLLAVSALLTACSHPPDDSAVGTATRLPPLPPAPTTETLPPGLALYSAKCAVCHGADGTAGWGRAANLHSSRLAPAAVRHTVWQGKSAMPAFAGQLSEAEAEQVVAYVLSLRH